MLCDIIECLVNEKGVNVVVEVVMFSFNFFRLSEVDNREIDSYLSGIWVKVNATTSGGTQHTADPTFRAVNHQALLHIHIYIYIGIWS